MMPKRRVKSSLETEVSVDLQARALEVVIKGRWWNLLSITGLQMEESRPTLVRERDCLRATCYLR
jgi:hypothetical protein